MAQDKDKARAEGFKRGLDGKSGAVGITQGWQDDKVSGPARTEGFIEGRRKRQSEEAKKARAKR